MAHVVGHLSVAVLEQRYRNCADGCAALRDQLIWALAQGHAVIEVYRGTEMRQGVAPVTPPI